MRYAQGFRFSHAKRIGALLSHPRMKKPADAGLFLVGQYPNFIITIIEDREYIEALYAKFLNIKAELTHTG